MQPVFGLYPVLGVEVPGVLLPPVLGLLSLFGVEVPGDLLTPVLGLLSLFGVEVPGVLLMSVVGLSVVIGSVVEPGTFPEEGVILFELMEGLAAKMSSYLWLKLTGVRSREAKMVPPVLLAFSSSSPEPSGR